MENKESICIRCARFHATCCQTSEVYVSPRDVLTIRDHIQQDDFYEFLKPQDPDYCAFDDEDPIWAQYVFRPDGSRRVLKRRDDGDCLFLGSFGCVLPLNVRPFVCRLFPLQYGPEGLYPEFSTKCPTELLDPTETLLSSMGLLYPEARVWHQELYHSIRLEKP
jgi:Fe-S-cluster containining protein